MAVDWHITVLQELVDCVAASECRRHSSLRAEVESTEEVKELPVMPYRAMPLHTVLCCAVLCCGVVWCGVLCCGVLWCGVLWCTVLCCGVLCCTVLFSSAPQSPSSLLFM